MAINNDILRGHIDVIILRRLIESDNYGYEVCKSISDMSDGIVEMKDATVYTAFRAMEQNGLISSYWGDGELGARRRYYSITDKGREYYEQETNDWQQSVKILNKLIIGG